MTTKLDDIIQALHTHTARPQHLQYLRSLHASHEALLKAAKNLEACVKKAPFNVLKDAKEAIRAAEELEK